MPKELVRKQIQIERNHQDTRVTPETAQLLSKVCKRGRDVGLALPRWRVLAEILLGALEHGET